MANIGSLTADLRLQSAAFMRDLTAASRAVASNTAQMRRSMRQVEAASRNLSRQFAQVRAGAAALAGALAVRQFATFTRAAIENADALAKTAQRIGITTTSLQELRIAAGQTGVDMAQLERAVTALVRRQGEAIAGNKGFAEGFARVGLSVADLQRLRPEALIREVAEGLTAIESQSLRVAAADRVMSEAGRQVINVFTGGAAALEAYAAQAREAGLVMDQATTRAAERLNDELALLRQAFSVGFDTAIIEGLSGSVDATAQSLREARRIGEEFGQAVAVAMRGVVAAGRFVADNMREIATAIAAILALKAAALFIALAGAVLKFVTATLAAARATNLLNAVLSRSVLGVVAKLAITLGAAALTWEAFGEAAAATADEIERAAGALRDELGSANGAAAGNVDKLIAALERENEQLALLRDAQGQGAEAIELANVAIETQNILARENIEANSMAGIKIADLVLHNRELRAEIERVAEAERAREAAAIRAAEEAARRTERIFETAAENIQTSFSDAFFEIFRGGELSFKDLAARIKDIFARLLAELVTLAIARPIIVPVVGALAGALGLGGGATGALTGNLGGGLGGLGAVSGLAGLGGFDIAGAINAFGASAAPGLFGFSGQGLATALTLNPGTSAGALAAFGGAGPAVAGAGALSLSGLLAAGGIGFLGGQTLAPLLGLNPTGAGLGGGLGAAAGFALGGPVGAVIGGVGGGLGGGLLGGLFGNREPSNLVQAGVFDFESGQVSRLFDPSETSRELEALRESVISGIGEGISAVLAAAGGELAIRSLAFELGQRDPTLVRVGGTGALPGRGGSVFTGPVGDAGFAITTAVRELLRGGLTGVSQTINTALQRSLVLQGAGFSPQQTAADISLVRSFDESTPASVFAELEDAAAALRESGLRALQLGVSLEKVNEGLARMGRELTEAAIGPLQAFRESLALLPISPLSPLERFGAAEALFEATAAAALAGEAAALQDLPGVAQSFLAISREVFASGPQFVASFHAVEDSLDRIFAQAEAAATPAAFTAAEQAAAEAALAAVATPAGAPAQVSRAPLDPSDLSFFERTQRGVFGTPGTSSEGGRQHGGLVHGGGLFTVGESGPELFVAPADGMVLSNRVFRSLEAAAAGGTAGGGLDGAGASERLLARLLAEVSALRQVMAAQGRDLDRLATAAVRRAAA